MAEDWLEAGPEEEDEPEAVEGIECPVCGDSFESEERMDEHSDEHSMAELFTALNSRLSKRVDQVSEGLSEQMNAQISALGSQLQQSAESSSQPEAVEEPSQAGSAEEEPELESGEEEEVLVGEEGERARTMAHAATETASELEKRGWSREDIAELMNASGPFLQGLGNLLAATKGPSGPSPFEEMGRSMFEASAELNEAMFREIGKALGRGAVFGGEEESEVEHK